MAILAGGYPFRTKGFTFILILLSILLATATRSGAAAPESKQNLEDEWRHAAQGWERLDDWKPQATDFQPRLQPAVVAVLFALLAVSGLLAFDDERQSKRTERRLASLRR